MKLEDLTTREKEVAWLMTQGLANQDIADKLGIALNTVKKHCQNISEKLGFNSNRGLGSNYWSVRKKTIKELKRLFKNV